jgi:hypothetical protein
MGGSASKKGRPIQLMSRTPRVRKRRWGKGPTPTYKRAAPDLLCCLGVEVRCQG